MQVIGWIMTATAWATGAALGAFAFRRLLLLGAALLPARPRPVGPTPPTATVLVPARDEAAGIGATLEALAKLDYPAERLFIFLIDDGSQDDTGTRMERWAADRPRVRVLRLPERIGKGAALRAGLLAAPDSVFVAVCDADLRPCPDWLRRIGEVFRDKDVGAAAPFLRPANATASPVARYAAVESWVHQLVTSAGKDALGLNPAANGAAGYRRSALADVGGFPSVPSGEDVWITAALTRAGWRTRWVRRAVVENTVVHRWRDYIHQHLRWSRNLLSAGVARPTASDASDDRVVPLARRAELWMMSSGYVDRLAILVAVFFVVAGRLPLWLPVAYGGIIVAQIVAALVRAGARSAIPRYLLWAAGFCLLDVGASAVGVVLHLLRRPRRWMPRRGHAAG